MEVMVTKELVAIFVLALATAIHIRGLLNHGKKAG